MRRVLLSMIALGLVVGVASWVVAQEPTQKSAPKHTTKEVMEQAHKSGLLKNVLDGKASKEDKDKLLDLYISLIDNKPPKGEGDKWSASAGWAIVAAAKVSFGREGALEDLKSATECKTCHTAHK